MIDYNRYILTSKDSALESIISNALLLSIQIVLLVFSSKWMGAINKLNVGIFIRKVIICEPPFEAVQLNIQYL